MTLLLVGLAFLVMGYIAGRLDFLTIRMLPNVGGGFSKSQFSRRRQEISIDDAKYVTDIDTSTLQKSYEEIGMLSVAADNVNEAANKLLQLKKK